MDNRESQALDDPRVVEASRDYLKDLEAGRRPDRESYFRRYPELQEALTEVFDGLELAQMLQARPNVPRESLAEPLGDFRIVREIGRGGMGVIYEAMQLSLGRKVALKVLPFAASLDARQRQRFQLEAHAAALLHHTNIVPIYAVGCERGLHFYAMQLIEGGSLAEFIAERKHVAERKTTALSEAPTTRHQRLSTQSPLASQTGSLLDQEPRTLLRSLVRLMIKVAEALEYAHQAGTIHRDVKPANLLLDHAGSIWITDFGLAQLTTDVSLTMTGDLLGTMRYMSPEQAGGQRAVLDGRTDIYSLGATMYELLTLHPVFPSASRQGLLHEILNEDPKSLRHWDRSIPVELETIVLKCLAKSPADRYATAAELAADLQRFLEERPILARRPTPMDIVRKWTRRHPAYVFSATLVLFSGVVGLGITTGIVAHQKQLTQDAWQQERERGREAEARFRMARRAADEMIQIAQRELTNSPFQDGTRKRLLQGALQYYQELIELRRDAAEDQDDLKQTRDQVTQILAELADLETSRELYLLREPDVWEDLAVTPKQRASLEEFVEQMEDHFPPGPPFAGPHDDATRKELVEQSRHNKSLISAILTEAQLARVRQIALQVEGPRIFFDPEISRQLNLTEEQRGRIRQIEHEWLFKPHGPKGLPRPPGPPNRETARRAVQEILKELAPAQLQIWYELVGRPYHGAAPHENGPGKWRRPPE